MRVDYTTQALLHLGEGAYRFLGVKCCRSCFGTIHNITKYCLDAAHARVKSVLSGNCEDDDEAECLVGRKRTASLVAQDFIEGWLRAQCMVNARKGNLHLPFYPVVRLVYDEFVLVYGVESCSLTTFTGVWKDCKKALRVTVPRLKSDLKTCSRCWWLSQERRAALRIRDVDLRAARVKEIEGEMREHQGIQYALRAMQFGRIMTAPFQRLEVAFLSQDATFPVNYPSIPQDSELKRAMAKIPQPFMAIMDHGGAGERAGDLCFYLYGVGKDDANVNASYLHWSVNKHVARSCRELHLDMDSGSDGKNWVVIGLLAYYVATGRFDRVHVHFLLTGHSGNKVDGLTSHMRVGLRRDNQWSPATVDLARYYKKQPMPCVEMFFDVPDGNSLVMPTARGGVPVQPLMLDFRSFLNDHVEQIGGYCAHNVEKPEYSIHEWILQKEACAPNEEPSHVTLRVKRLPSDEQWSGPARVLSLSKIPPGQPARLLAGKPGNSLFGNAAPLAGVCNDVLQQAGAHRA